MPASSSIRAVVRAALQVSLGKARTTVGPLGALANLPFVGAAGTSVASVASAAR